MVKVKYAFLLIPFMVFGSCAGNRQAKVDMELTGAADSTAVIVSKLSMNRLLVLDTLYTESGKVTYRMEVGKDAPEFVYMTAPGRENVSLILQEGDRINVSVPAGGSPVITGSPESLKLQEADAEIAAFNRRFDSLTVVLDNAMANGDASLVQNLKVELGRAFVKRKQEAIRYIFSNFRSMSVIPVLYQKTSSGISIFSEATDALLMEKVYDSLKAVYPSSPYLVSLADEVAVRKNVMEFINRSQNAEEVDFPEIALSDINGETRTLSSLKGKVIALIFWTIENEAQRQYNVYLKSLYEKYSRQGFEIYQVSLDTNKTSWAMQVKEQNLPWINVCDPASGASAAAMLYNVRTLPAMYLIGKDGQIVAKDLFDQRLEGEIRRQL